MRDLQLAFELIRNFATRAGISSHAEVRMTLTFSDRRDQSMFESMVKREFDFLELYPNPVEKRPTLAGIPLSYDNDQDIALRYRPPPTPKEQTS